ncbi:hypothetical protein FFLO_00683 [Filobasidium floriforme]|uniref:Protein FRA10AC1 n=1 Tax=Filobasidium floriforme TaxID=5210 RepID=A0A8K0NTB4_9TREE|nr:folate-sensitive fragile site protein Fra10Ac1-domain-containing protein [Filobasidium floriforme]KAG7571331.1 hypothetical protein FFLO_00683 [Filobasidium floriforme]KAH8086282.1 folate-sensitive fragile site protein Fra10Ac1-domain-containing protein [Filobasidium floriforme]
MSAFPPKYGREFPKAESSSSRATRNTLYGSTAYQREKARAVTYGTGPSSQISQHNKGKTEFIREGEDPKDVTWEERIARAYESKLFKEFALIDLKHYKTKRIALRWRTAEEVVGAIGEETCGSLRCPYHNPLPEHLVEEGARMPQLQAFELPFTYAEAGETKTALVKVKVCHRCAKKLLFKPGEEERSSRNRSAGREDMLNEAAAPSGQDLDRRPAIVTGIDLCRQQRNGAQNEIVMIVIK